jgi:hypothetical protein
MYEKISKTFKLFIFENNLYFVFPTRINTLDFLKNPPFLKKRVTNSEKETNSKTNGAVWKREKFLLCAPFQSQWELNSKKVMAF